MDLQQIFCVTSKFFLTPFKPFGYKQQLISSKTSRKHDV